jgi:hypothetical protein
MIKERRFRSFLYILVACLILATTLTAQPGNAWMRFYDNIGNADYLYDVFVTVNGSYAMCGHTQVDQGNVGYWLVLADENGQELTQQIYVHERFPSISNWCYSLIQNDDGGFLFGGRVKEGNVSHFSVLRVDPEYNEMWWSEYGDVGWAAECYAVIELKNGEFVAVGRNGGFQAYAVKLNGEGDVLWEHTFNGRWFRSLREVDGGMLIAGQDDNRDAWLLKIDFEGEVVWSRSFRSGQLMALISCHDGGFAASGHRTGEGGDFLLLRVDDDGNEIWSNAFDFGDNDWSNSLTQMWDNGFTLVGESRSDNASIVLRIDNSGNEMWRRSDGSQEHRMRGYKSIVVGNDGMVLAVGTGYTREHGQRPDGVLTKIMLDVSPPEIVLFIPQKLQLTTLQRDSIEFSVLAEDLQDDSLYYYWALDEDTIATDTSATIIFEELDDHIVECFVSDGELADSVSWLVHVEEFFISGFEPDSLNLTIQRGTEINFGIDVAAIDEIEVENTWTLTHRNEQQEEIGDEEAVVVTFDQSGRHQIQAFLRHDDESDEVTWVINVRSAIWSWWPSELEVAAYVDSTQEFLITPFNEESDSLDYLWFLNDEQLESDSASVSITFIETGQSQLTSIVHDGIETDTIHWTVNVEEWSFTADEADLAELLFLPVLYPSSPNPFNSTVKLSIYMPKIDHVSLSVFDINGREVSRLVDGNVGAGRQTFVWNAGDFSAGVYVVRMSAGDVSEMRKMVLVR